MFGYDALIFFFILFFESVVGFQMLQVNCFFLVREYCLDIVKNCKSIVHIAYCMLQIANCKLQILFIAIFDILREYRY